MDGQGSRVHRCDHLVDRRSEKGAIPVQSHYRGRRGGPVISSLEIRNFKRFRALRLNLRPMTVLTGLNGTGKSTSIQAFLLARQIAEKPGTPVVQLNGPHGLALGDSQDVLHFDAEGEEIEINVTCAGTDYSYHFKSSGGRHPNLQVARRPETPSYRISW
ncbi:MAG: AAA family ATPase [Pseudonocardiaceae bacterium]